MSLDGENNQDMGVRNITLMAVLLWLGLVLGGASASGQAQFAGVSADPIVGRNLDVPRSEASKLPRSEGDQALVGGWPMYRSERGQRAFNDAMATLAATESVPPHPANFKGCLRLECHLSLPPMSADGWLPAGRFWVSPSEYVLIAHSARNKSGKYRRHPFKRMKYFVYHEFINSSRNVDPYDTISSHSDDVFVSFYMSKTSKDALGRRFVTVIQIAPYDVISVHATNMDSLGPGIEVAKNAGETLETLQATAGVLVATLVKSAAPHLEVVNHRGVEGLPMLEAYQDRLERLPRHVGAGTSVKLPFVPAQPQRLVSVSAGLGDLIVRPGVSRTIPVAQRQFVPMQAAVAHPAPLLLAPPRPARRPAPAGLGRGTLN